MRKVIRSKVDLPPSLLDGGSGPAELASLRTFRSGPNPPPGETKKKSFTHRAHKGDDVKQALEALFHGKCAYCETMYAASMPVDVEHYRPKGAVAEDPEHEGYWWLAYNWENLLPSCGDCNRKRGQIIVELSDNLAELAANTKKLIQSGKKDSFPIAAGGVRAVAEAHEFELERPLLLNPCNDDPSLSLTYSFDPAHPIGLMLPIGEPADRERGAISIQAYGLNRLKLVQDRTRLLRHLEFLGDLVIELTSSIDALEEPATVAALVGTPAAKVAPRLRLLRDGILSEIVDFARDDAPYSTMARTWAKDFRERVRR
ncbi:hypothetical protein ACC757_24310 [Rhizobium ruizarguesonis]